MITKYGIVLTNQIGSLWTNRLFDSKSEVEMYMSGYKSLAYIIIEIKMPEPVITLADINVGEKFQLVELKGGRIFVNQDPQTPNMGSYTTRELYFKKDCVAVFTGYPGVITFIGDLKNVVVKRV